jgi:hypothetical protein
MKTEVRTRITEFADSIDATFDLIEGIVADPQILDDRLAGAVLRPVERVETDENGVLDGSIVFEVTYPSRDGSAPAIPEMERVLIPS